MLDTGQNPQLSIEPMRDSFLETLNDFTSWMEAATKEAHSAISQAANDMAHFYNTRHREAPLYEVRDKVWLNGQNIMTTCLMKKLDHIWLGPYSGQIYLTKHLGSSYLRPSAKPTPSSQSLYNGPTRQTPSPNEYNATHHPP